MTKNNDHEIIIIILFHLKYENTEKYLSPKRRRRTKTNTTLPLKAMKNKKYKF